MVRTTIACAPCRRMKVKCKHEGLPPCHNCSRKGQPFLGQCVLSGPTLSNSRQSRQKTLIGGNSPPSNGPCRIDNFTASTLVPDPLHESALQLSTQLDFLSNIDNVEILQACYNFRQKFPELRFLHLPTISRSLRSLETPEIAKEHGSSTFRAFLASVMAVYVSITKSKPGLPGADRFANVVRHRATISLPPDLMTVQTLLVLSMYEWGIGNRHQAWMTGGMAVRMMQSLLAIKSSAPQSQVELQIYNRTVWSCFVIDRLILSGIPQPATLSHKSLHTFWPSSEEDFTFGQSPAETESSELGHSILDNMHGNMANYYSVLVRGFDIWTRIFKWVISGGRRLPGMDLPDNSPWVSTSPWARLYEELRTWRELQEKRMLYPEATVENHAALGQAEPFAYLNLIYYISLLFLGREYLPFLPTTCTEPSGSIDPPLLSSDPPIGWWHDRAKELFSSAVRISMIMKDLENVDASLSTPFPGFCLFSAVTTNMYALAFPWMNPNKNPDDLLLMQKSLCSLDTFREVWQIGEGWWLTSQRCKRLYDYASADLNRVRGLTRADFDALESSIHDCQGHPSTNEDAALQNGVWVDGYNMSERSDEQGLRDAQHSRDISDVNMQTDLDWDQLWSLWIQSPNIPLASGGFSSL